jgi:hypothetical protein
MLKQVKIILAGSGKVLDGFVTESDTPAALIERLGLDGQEWHLSTDGTSKSLIPSNQDIFPRVQDGEALWATSDPEFGSRVGVVTPTRSLYQLPFFQREGWAKVKPNLYRGYYKTELGNFPGEIEIIPGWGHAAFIHSPPQKVKNHPCFEPVGNGWYRGNFENTKVSIGEAILAMELLINTKGERL